MNNKWKEILKQFSFGMGALDSSTEKETLPSPNDSSNTKKRKAKLKLGLLKG